MKFLQHLHTQGCAPRLEPRLLDDCPRDGPFGWGIQVVGVEKNVCIQKTINGHESPLGPLDGHPSGNLHVAEPMPPQAEQQPFPLEEPSQALESPNFSSRCGDAQQPPSFAPKSRQEVQLSFSYGQKYGTIAILSSSERSQWQDWSSLRFNTAATREGKKSRLSHRKACEICHSARQFRWSLEL